MNSNCTECTDNIDDAFTSAADLESFISAMTSVHAEHNTYATYMDQTTRARNNDIVHDTVHDTTHDDPVYDIARDIDIQLSEMREDGNELYNALDSLRAEFDDLNSTIRDSFATSEKMQRAMLGTLNLLVGKVQTLTDMVDDLHARANALP